MFNTLLESRRQRQRAWGGTTTSVVAHAAVILVAVQMTLRADPRHEGQLESVVYVEPKDDAPLPPKPPIFEPPPPPPGSSVLSTVIEIPDVLPPIDPSRPITNEDDFRGMPGTRREPTPGAAPTSARDEPYFETMVEKPVAEASNSQRPRYPDLLKSAGVEGSVIAEFVVDTVGRVELPSFRILRQSHDLFGAAVRAALPGMRFLPAEVGGRRVRQLVQQPFVFAIQR